MDREVSDDVIITSSNGVCVVGILTWGQFLRKAEMILFHDGCGCFTWMRKLLLEMYHLIIDFTKRFTTRTALFKTVMEAHDVII